MTEEEKNIIKIEIDRRVEAAKIIAASLPDGIIIETSPHASISINFGIELISEALGIELQEANDEFAHRRYIFYKDVHLYQWVRIGKKEF